ncbi:hypothetical protein VZT92_025674 [Zoarces viviparus]|uniref:Uncharacterized protein n=1 Tax=Zoarces viviparus TaxID=48416 RepID=A0AAW1DY15_ZOAVI
MPQRKRSFTFGAYGGVDKTFSKARSLWKQDGSDPRLSGTLEPQLFQPTVPYATSPFHKVGGERPLTLSDGPLCDLCSASLLILSLHRLLSGYTCSVFCLDLICHDCIRL